MLLTKHQILEQRLKTEKLDLGDDKEIIVRALPVHIVERAEKIQATDYGPDAFVFVNAVVDEQGKRIYADEDAAQVAEMVDGGLLQLVVSKSYALARLDPETRKRIKKNWTTQPGSNSGE